MSKITIIGAGIVGSAIAYELSKNTAHQITIIDQNTAVGSGCTSAALGVLMGIISKKTKGRAWNLRESTIKRYKNLITELEAITGDNIYYNQDGIVKLLFPDDDLSKWQKLLETRQKQGWNLEIWSPEKLGQMLPQINLNSNLQGAVYSPQDGQVHPLQLTHALWKAAQIQGVKLCLGQKVQKIENKPINDSKNEPICHVYTEDAEYISDHLIITAGLGSSFLTELLAQPVEIRPVLGQALQLQLDQSFGNCDFQPVITGDDVHIVPLANNQCWVGATLEFPDENNRLIPQDILLTEVRQKAIEFCPQLENSTIIKTWSGERPRPYNQSAPIIKKLEGYDNIILATGHYRNGVLLAPSTALKVTEMLT